MFHLVNFPDLRHFTHKYSGCLGLVEDDSKWNAEWMQASEMEWPALETSKLAANLEDAYAQDDVSLCVRLSQFPCQDCVYESDSSLAVITRLHLKYTLQ